MSVDASNYATITADLMNSGSGTHEWHYTVISPEGLIRSGWHLRWN